MSKISIIVPVYNVQSYLSDCIKSILCQTFKDFELILVDDGSTDLSGQICDEYLANDSRINVFHQTNRGVSSARNLGLMQAKGEYVTFVDSDDWVESDYLETLFDGINEDIVLSISGYSKYEVGQIEPCYCTDSNKTGVLCSSDFIEQLYQPEISEYVGYICGKLYKRSIIREYDIWFDKDIIYNEDRLFLCRYLCAINGLVYWNMRPTYHYCIREDSAMNLLSNINAKLFLTDLKSLAIMRRLVLSVNKAFESKTEYSLFQSYHTICVLAENHNSFIIKWKARFIIIQSIGFVRCVHYFFQCKC